MAIRRHYEAGDTDGLAPIMFTAMRGQQHEAGAAAEAVFRERRLPELWSSGAEHHVIFVGAQHELRTETPSRQAQVQRHCQRMSQLRGA